MIAMLVLGGVIGDRFAVLAANAHHGEFCGEINAFFHNCQIVVEVCPDIMGIGSFRVISNQHLTFTVIAIGNGFYDDISGDLFHGSLERVGIINYDKFCSGDVVFTQKVFFLFTILADTDGRSSWHHWHSVSNDFYQITGDVFEFYGDNICYLSEFF